MTNADLKKLFDTLSERVDAFSERVDALEKSFAKLLEGNAENFAKRDADIRALADKTEGEVARIEAAIAMSEDNPLAASLGVMEVRHVRAVLERFPMDKPPHAAPESE